MKRASSAAGAPAQKRRVVPVPIDGSQQQQQQRQQPPQPQPRQRQRTQQQQRQRRPTSAVLKMRADASKLPISMAKERLLAAIGRQAVTIVVGETGSGKTTQLPQFLLDAGYASPDKMIGVTQPRRVAAVTVAARVAKEQGQALGKTVGYTIRFDDKSSRSTRVRLVPCRPQPLALHWRGLHFAAVRQIKYLTDGMLLREALTDRHLDQYSVIVLDEAHERTVSTDVLFALVKRELKLQQQKQRQLESGNNARGDIGLRVVVMSATLEAEKYSKYFDGAGIEYVEGRQFPVSLMYTPAPESDFIDGTLVTTMQVHLTKPLDGDILVFLPGQEDIEALQRLIEQKLKDLPAETPTLLVRVLYAALPQEQQMKAFDETPPGCRKVIIATNIAETSLTVSGLRYVVDCGLVKQRTHSTTGMDVLQTAPISQAQARQRSGRAGREAPGSCYRVYTEADYSELVPTTTPEIIRADLATVMLQLLSMGVENPLEFDFLDTPRKESTVRDAQPHSLTACLMLRVVSLPSAAISERATRINLQRNLTTKLSICLKRLCTVHCVLCVGYSIVLQVQAMEHLHALGAVDKRFVLTTKGRQMADFPLAPIYASMLLRSAEFGCTEVSVCAPCVGQSVIH
jgi:ATP-dependent RNA helicase DHX8/PRP22